MDQAVIYQKQPGILLASRKENKHYEAKVEEGEMARISKIDKNEALLKLVKVLHSVVGSSADEQDEHLDKQRAAQEKLYVLSAPSHGIERTQIDIDGIPAEWTSALFPHEHKHVILYCHGGGYTCGGLGYARILASKLALATGYDVLSFEYRLAPEHPYPAAIEDGMKVWDALMLKGYAAENVVLAGDSAGGNMALEIVLELKKQNRFLPAGLVLMSPWTDMTATSKSYEKHKDNDPILTREYVEHVRKAYAGEREDYRVPELSPLYGDLEHMPPTIIQVGSNEILRSDSELLFKKLEQNDCVVDLKVYKGAWHVFQQTPIQQAQLALTEINRFIREQIWK